MGGVYSGIYYYFYPKSDLEIFIDNFEKEINENKEKPLNDKKKSFRKC